MINPTDSLQSIMQRIFPMNAPGAALLVATAEGVQIEAGFGTANLETGEKITANTNFRMASVSKQFTAWCIYSLQEKGRLHIDDRVIKYLPSLPGFAKPITIQHLLTHTSGLADYEKLIPANRKTQVSDRDVLELTGRSKELYFTPGTQFRYSNTAYCLLTQIVEKVSGTPYRDFICQNLFLPANMPASKMYGGNVLNRAYGYHLRDRDWIFADQSITSATMGDGCVYTSVREYRNWLQYLWSHDSAIAPFQRQVQVNRNFDYGYGWFVGTEADGSTAYFHSGESTGFHNIVYHNPGKRLMIILFSNADDERAATAFHEIMKVMQVRLKGIEKGQKLFDVLSGIYE